MPSVPTPLVFSANAVVLATGLVDVLPDIPGLADLWGRDVHVCPCFSGHEVRNERIIPEWRGS